MSVEENMRLMQTLDDAWNSQDWATFEKRHAKDVDVFWPAQADPTHGRQSHKDEAIAFFKIFPDNKVGTGHRRSSSARETIPALSPSSRARLRARMTTPDGKVIPPNGKKFKVDFCTVAHWKKGEIVEEKLFYDKISLMQQIGLM